MGGALGGVRGLGLALPALLAGACAVWRGAAADRIRASVRAGDPAGALEALESSREHRLPRNRLLLLLERGSLLARAGRFQESARALEEAKDVLADLHTRSLRRDAAVLLANDAGGDYRGGAHEESHLRLLQVLNFLALSQDAALPPGGRRANLLRARAELVAWDASPGAPGRDDLASRMIGAIVHEELDTAADRQIALQLAKDALRLAKGPWSAWRSLDGNGADFLSPRAPAPPPPAPTEAMEALGRHLARQLLRTTARSRPAELPSARRELGLPRDAGDAEDARGGPRPNLTLLVEKGVVPARTAATQHLSLGSVLADPDKPAVARILAGVGAVVLMDFAVTGLGLAPPPDDYSPVGAWWGLNMAAALVDGVAVRFQLPAQEARPEPVPPVAVVRDAAGAVVLREPLVLASPVGERARKAVLEGSARRYLRVGTRLALKHLAAIAAARATWSMLGGGKDGRGGLFARQAAVVQYLAAARAIEASERADLRQWSTLPSSVWLLDAALPPGSYEVSVADPAGGEAPVGAAVLEDGAGRLFLRARVL